MTTLHNVNKTIEVTNLIKIIIIVLIVEITVKNQSTEHRWSSLIIIIIIISPTTDTFSVYTHENDIFHYIECSI